MKVKLFNKRLLHECGKLWACITTFISTLLVFIDLSQKARILLGAATVVFYLGVYIFLLIRANHQNQRTLLINGTTVIVKYGDIFQQAGIKVIAFNEYFDTHVGDEIISPYSLNGKYIQKYWRKSKVHDLDQRIKEKAPSTEGNSAPKVYDRGYGKSVKYPLGTICLIDDYALLAFSHFDNQNKAKLTIREYLDCLLAMWDSLDNSYNGKPINIPLLGSGITRFGQTDLTDQELLDYILLSLRISRIEFKYGSTITIVLDSHESAKINLYDLPIVDEAGYDLSR